MSKLQYIFQVLIKPGFLILFLFGFLGSNCGRVKEGTAPQNTKKQGGGETLEEQIRQLAADEKALAELEKEFKKVQKEFEEVRQTGDAAKLAEVERKLKELESKWQQRQKQATCRGLDGNLNCLANVDMSQEKSKKEALTCVMSNLNEFQNEFQVEDQLALSLSLSSAEKTELLEVKKTLLTCDFKLQNPEEALKIFKGCLAQYTAQVKSVFGCN